jgi:hypothetical protein
LNRRYRMRAVLRRLRRKDASLWKTDVKNQKDQAFVLKRIKKHHSKGFGYCQTRFSCSTWTTRCSITIALRRSSDIIWKRRSAAKGRNVIGTSSSNYGLNSVMLIISARCNVTAAKSPHDPRLLTVSHFLIDYPFVDRLFPHSVDVVEGSSNGGPAVILSDGDVVFRPHKVERSGLFKAVNGNVLIYVHKEQELDDVAQRFPGRALRDGGRQAADFRRCQRNPGPE